MALIFHPFPFPLLCDFIVPITEETEFIYVTCFSQKDVSECDTRRRLKGADGFPFCSWNSAFAVRAHLGSPPGGRGVWSSPIAPGDPHEATVDQPTCHQPPEIKVTPTETRRTTS